MAAQQNPLEQMEPDYFKDMTPTIRKTQKVGIVLSTKLMEDFLCFKINYTLIGKLEKVLLVKLSYPIETRIGADV